MTLRPTRLAQPPARAETGLFAMRSPYGIGLSRSATAIALLLSLLLHVAFILALLRPEPAPQAIARVDVVSVHLVPTQPAATATASEPPLPPRRAPRNPQSKQRRSVDKATRRPGWHLSRTCNA